MSHVFVASAVRITTTGRYDDVKTTVDPVIVSVREDFAAAQEDLLAWAREQPADRQAEHRLAVTEADPSTGDVIASTGFTAVSTIELVPSDPASTVG